MQVRRHLARWTAWFVLLNIGVGFCDCLRDPVSVPIHSNSSAVLTTDSHRQGDSDCGDNCESCVCHASIVTIEPARFNVELVVSRLSAFPVLSSSDPDYVRIKRPPIA
jgi:hypothetical protein